MEKKFFRLIKTSYRNFLLKYQLRGSLTGKSCNIEDIGKSGAAFYRPVKQPFVLISQIQRSGGSLLSQLFDGHPQCYAHPHELKIGPPKSQNSWPKINLDEPLDLVFLKLFERTTPRFLKKGFQKGKHSKEYPCFIIPSLQPVIFKKYLESLEKVTVRDILDAYWTSYFNSWLDLQHKYHPDKRIITGFAPGISINPVNIHNFFEAYPDGCLISLIRNPLDWYGSAKHQRGKRSKFGTIEGAMEWWEKAAHSMLFNKQNFNDKLIILDFSRLIENTEGVMKFLADKVGIDYIETLLEPTFNTMPMRANTSFSVSKSGIIKEVLERRKKLEKSELQYLEKYMPLYHKVLQRASG